MNSKSTSLYHAFTSILFAVFLVSCSSNSEATLNAPETHSSVKAEKSSIPEEIKDVLSKSTCLGCHKMKTKLILELNINQKTLKTELENGKLLTLLDFQFGL